jgi:phospho-N-acetylmuramoyl-pentapeptide-transferase
MFQALYGWFYDPEGPFSFIRLFYYISSRTVFAIITSFVFTLLAGRPLIRALYRMGMRDTQRAEMVEAREHKKGGTPTMGGVILFSATMLSALLWCDLTNRFILFLLAASVWFFALGFWDDMRKIRHRDSNKGLSRRMKYAGQISFGLLLSLFFLHPSTSPVPATVVSKFYIPYYKYPLADLSWGYTIVIVLFVVYAANAINFADGMDGLAIVPSAYAIGVYGVFAYMLGNAKYSQYLMFDYLPGCGEVSILCAALLGACAGFLWYNSYPAEIFMGDTGSMFLGGVLGTMVVLLKQEVLFLIVGGIFLAEILSVALQDWIGIQRTGRRFLYRAPLHHTFQYQGLAETKITVRFWIVSGVLALLALGSLKIR